MPRIRLSTAVNSRISSRLPMERISTTSASTRPTPVWETAPTMMPAVAVAMPMPIMLRAPLTRPFHRSSAPSRMSAAMSLLPRNSAISGRWVSMMKIISTVAQKAESPGERRSTIRHQTSTITGRMYCRPTITVGRVCGSL